MKCDAQQIVIGGMCRPYGPWRFANALATKMSLQTLLARNSISVRFFETVLTKGEKMIPGTATTIEQRGFLKGYQKLVIRPDGDLEVFFKKFPIERQFRIQLSQINPKPQRHKFQSVGSLVGVIIFSALSLITLWGGISCLFSPPDRSIAPVLFFPFAFFVVFTGVCFSKFGQQSVNAMIFYIRDGGQIHVWFEKPDAKIFNSFCESLSKQCEQAWNNRPLDPSVQSVAGEIAALKSLHVKGILTDAEFERAKAKLIDQGESKERKIGFI